ADGPQGPAGEDGRSVEDISTVDVLDPVTNEVIGTEITFLDGDNTPIGNPVTVYNGKDGEDGQDGATPEIIDGNWWIDGQDTGVAVEDEDGIYIIDVETVVDTDTVKGAEGEDTILKDDDRNDVGSVIVYHGVDGEDGQDGATPEIIDGNWWIDGQDTGVAAEGKDGQDGATGEIIDDNRWMDSEDTDDGAEGRDERRLVYV